MGQKTSSANIRPIPSPSSMHSEQSGILIESRPVDATGTPVQSYNTIDPHLSMPPLLHLQPNFPPPSYYRPSSESTSLSLSTPFPFRVAVLGGGLVGSLAALMCAQRQCRVDIYEQRDDPQQQQNRYSNYRAKSINLALSARGIAALEAAQILPLIAPYLIPMKGRFIHTKQGDSLKQLYGTQQEVIYSVDRELLNKILLEEAMKTNQVSIHYRHELIKAKLDQGECTFYNGHNNQLRTVHGFDFILGCDGVHSASRRELSRKVLFQFKQTYITHSYKELTLPADKETNESLYDESYLHIWPREEFMLIALPNVDKSFTCTLFMSQTRFDALSEPELILSFFKTEFPDFMKNFNPNELLEQFQTHPTGPLVSIECTPYHYEHYFVLLGDAAHAMVPFYGQGMNCGFEDVHILFQTHLDPLFKQTETLATPNAVSLALQEYSQTRHANVTAMCRLALDNYIEMRYRVLTLSYRISHFWMSLMKNLFISRYSRVSFSHEPYSRIVEREVSPSALSRLRVWLWRAGIVSCVIKGLFCHHVTRQQSLITGVLISSCWPFLNRQEKWNSKKILLGQLTEL